MPNKSIPSAQCRDHRYSTLMSCLAFLSGSCGLAYEVLYVRFFSNYFGNSFEIAGILLSTVFFGIAFGAWQSRRFMRALAVIEIGIGLYAICLFTAFSFWGFDIVGFWQSSYLNGAKLIVFLGIPAFLIGTCVPLFAVYIQSRKTSETQTFTWVYMLYNFGAFMSVLMIEFLLLRQFGLRMTGYVIGFINLLIGASLLLHKRQEELLVPSKPLLKNSRIFIALFLASFASGIFQLFVLRLSYSVFGPLHENFAIILAAIILGVALGSWAVLRGQIEFRQALAGLALLILPFLVFTPLFIDTWAVLVNAANSDFTELGYKILLLAGYPLALFILFGALVPLAVKAHKGDDVSRSGPLLAVSALGNGMGVLVMFWGLYETFSLPMIGVFIFILLGLAYLVCTQKTLVPLHVFATVLMTVSLGFATFKLWPYRDLLLGYRTIASAEQLDHRRRTYADHITYKAYDQDASIVMFNDQIRSLVFNGYHSLSFGPHSKSELHEVIVGATPALFSAHTRNALVLGLGTGITAGSTAQIYAQTKVVEINPAIFNIPHHFIPENQNVMGKASVDILQQDGISTLVQNPQTYDAIVNTVTSPHYYSASKLYTADFYDIVKSRLSEGGVYSSWFDLNITHHGISIMLNTLEAHFKTCRYFLLTHSYFNVVCGDGPLIYRSSQDTQARFQTSGLDKVLQRYKFQNGLAETLNALEIDLGPDFLNRTTEHINTLDLPAIEFVVARKSDKDATTQVLSDAILANIEFQRKTAFGTSHWMLNCQIISQMSHLKFKGC